MSHRITEKGKNFNKNHYFLCYEQAPDTFYSHLFRNKLRLTNETIDAFLRNSRLLIMKQKTF